MSEDEELEQLKAKRLAEMQKNLSQKKDQELHSEQMEKEKQKIPSKRDLVIKHLGYRGMEVLQNAEFQFPAETQMIVDRLGELLQSGEINETIEGGELLALFRSLGLRVRMETKINVEQNGKFVSLSDKLGAKSSHSKSDNSSNE